jgi:hypothetical protein
MARGCGEGGAMEREEERESGREVVLFARETGTLFTCSQDV